MTDLQGINRIARQAIADAHDGRFALTMAEHADNEPRRLEEIEKGRLMFASARDLLADAINLCNCLLNSTTETANAPTS